MRDPRLHWYRLGINFKIFDEHPVSPPPGKVTLVQHKNETKQTRVERTSTQHSTASYHGRPANRNTQCNSISRLVITHIIPCHVNLDI